MTSLAASRASTMAADFEICQQYQCNDGILRQLRRTYRAKCEKFSHSLPQTTSAQQDAVRVNRLIEAKNCAMTVGAEASV